MDSTGDSLRGYAFAVSAYLLWGFLPFYLKAVAGIAPTEVLVHRIIWSVPVAGLVLVALGRTRDIRAAQRDPRMLGMGVITAALISINWLVYIWAIANERAVEAALGYYINPLFSVLLGAVLLGEKLSAFKWVSIGLAAIAVVILTITAGEVPLVAIGLTLSWGCYALAKKQLPIGPNQGFLLEVLILLPFGAGYAVWLGATGQAAFLAAPGDTWLLLAAGPITAVPLILYANGAKLLRLSTIGMLQYIAPTMIFLVAVFAFGEPFGTGRAIAFPLIWLALVIFSWDLLQEARRNRRASSAPVEPQAGSVSVANGRSSR